MCSEIRPLTSALYIGQSERMQVALEVADDARLATFAERVAKDRVDPVGIEEHAWLHGDPVEVLNRLRVARDWRTDQGGVAWVVTADDDVVGYISALISADSTAETFSVVAADMQRRGIGREARRLALERLRQLGVQRAVSVSRPGSGSSAISRSLGYRPSGREVRSAPGATDVELERWEMELTDA